MQAGKFTSRSCRQPKTRWRADGGLAYRRSADEDTLLFVHANKTAAMIKVSLFLSFLLGNRGDDKELFHLVSQGGQSLGLAFQAVDDLLDSNITTETLGKDAAWLEEA